MEDVNKNDNICFICLDKTSDIDTKFIRDFMSIPCNCGWSSHIKCYEEWTKTTDMICPYCRLKYNYNYDEYNIQQPRIQIDERIPQNVAIVEIVNRNRLHGIFIIRCVNMFGTIFLILFIYCLIFSFMFSVSKIWYIKNYSPLQPIEFY